MSIQPSRILTQCPMCQASYAADGIQLVSEQTEAKLYHCACSACGHAMLAVILEASGWVSSVGMVTDLEVKDVPRFQSVQTIGADECIRMHQALENDGRAFCELLRRTEA